MKIVETPTDKLPTITHDANIYDVNGKTVVGIVDDISEHHAIFEKWGLQKQVDVYQQSFNYPRKLGMFADVHDNEKDRIQYVIGFELEVANALLNSEIPAIFVFDKNGKWKYAMNFVNKESLEQCAKMFAVTDATLDMMGVKKNRTHL